MVVFVRFKGLGGDIDTEGFIFLHLEDYSTLRPLLFLTIDYIWEGQSFHSQQGPRHQGIRNTWLTHKVHLYSVGRGSGEERKLMGFADVFRCR